MARPSNRISMSEDHNRSDRAGAKAAVFGCEVGRLRRTAVRVIATVAPLGGVRVFSRFEIIRYQSRKPNASLDALSRARRRFRCTISRCAYVGNRFTQSLRLTVATLILTTECDVLLSCWFFMPVLAICVPSPRATSVPLRTCWLARFCWSLARVKKCSPKKYFRKAKRSRRSPPSASSPGNWNRK